MTAITASPLTWPNGWPRTAAHDRQRARFAKKTDRYYQRPVTIDEATRYTLDQLRLMGVHHEDVIVSTDLKLRLDGLPYSNQREPEDPGASVWWRPRGADKERVIAIDIYDRIADNIYAIGKTLEAMRGIERWGGGEILERTFTGFTALPPPEMAGGVDPFEVIQVSRQASADEQRTAYRRALSASHPDKGGDPDRFRTVIEAGRALGLA